MAEFRSAITEYRKPSLSLFLYLYLSLYPLPFLLQCRSSTPDARNPIGEIRVPKTEPVAVPVPVLVAVAVPEARLPMADIRSAKSEYRIPSLLLYLFPCTRCRSVAVPEARLPIRSGAELYFFYFLKLICR
jgi:hypothetical protein